MEKLTSRKLWLAIGGSAAGIGSIVSGIVIDNETITIALTIVGAILAAVSIVAYNFAEAYVDAASVSSNTTQITASTTSAQTVEKLLAKEEK